MKKQFSMTEFDIFIKELCLKEKYLYEISQEDLIEEFDNNFTEDFNTCGGKYCYIWESTDERMNKAGYDLKENEGFRYVSREISKPKPFKPHKNQVRLDI